MEGYNYLGPRTRNPYRADYGKPVKVGWKEGCERQYQEWDDGWTVRFYGDVLDAPSL